MFESQYLQLYKKTHDMKDAFYGIH